MQSLPRSGSRLYGRALRCPESHDPAPVRGTMSNWGFTFVAFGFVTLVASTLGEGAVKAFGFTIPSPLKEHVRLMRSIGVLSCVSGVLFIAGPVIWHSVTKPSAAKPSLTTPAHPVRAHRYLPPHVTLRGPTQRS